ncbi:SDR family oxidoreductase [Parablastomonas sp. CN1-191]|uniref:SDR family oxidoreductase n=1 Tax=Parablastomonas sp. CN1-191 TaxID=3400908 RepID=UPI003BF7920D
MTAGPFDLSGRKALVTGGAQGLGRMIAESLVAAGAEVMITSRKQDALDAARAELGRQGQVHGAVADLSTPEAAKALADEVSRAMGGCAVLVNNAGKTFGAPIESFPDKAWAGIMAVNVQTPFTLVRELLPLLRASASADDPARVINVGSVAGLRTERLSAYSYSASKAAIHMLTRDLAGDLAADNITVNALVPGFFPTRMTAHMQGEDGADPALLAHIPLKRLGRAGDIGGAAVFLSSRAGSYVTGVLLPVDGGLAGCG